MREHTGCGVEGGGEGEGIRKLNTKPNTCVEQVYLVVRFGSSREVVMCVCIERVAASYNFSSSFNYQPNYLSVYTLHSISQIMKIVYNFLFI